MRVLQIEDDESTARAVAQTLKSKGIACDTAVLGEEAIDLAVRNPYDLILLDIMLPDIDGYEVLRRLRDADIHTPVVIQSALIGRDDMDRAGFLGAVDRLTKPFSGRDLQECVASVLERAGREDPDSVPSDQPPAGVSRRRHRRVKTLKSGEILDQRSQPIGRCLVVNMSAGGAALKIADQTEIPETFVLRLERGPTRRCHVCWRHADKIGVMFVLSSS